MGSALFACAAPAPSAVTPPAETGYLAIVELDGAGALTGSSRLVPWREGSALPIYAHDASASVLLLGYPGAAVDALARLAGRTGGFDARVRLATGCEQALPAPVWAASWGADGALEVRDAASAPALTVAGLEDACPDLSTADTPVDLRCPAAHCPAVLSSASRCTLALDLSSCDFGVLHATFDAAGHACVEPALGSPAVCAPREGDDSSRAPYGCTSPRACALDVYLAPKTAEPPYYHSRALFDAAPWLPSSLADPRTVGNVYQDSLAAGWAYDLVVLADRVLVAAAPDGRTPAKLCPSDHSSAPTSLYTLDLALSSVRTATAPDCLQRMTPTPEGDGFYATFTEGSAWRVGRFDADGHLTATAPTTVPWDWWQVLDLAVTGDVLTVLASAVGGGSELHVHALDTLAELKVLRFGADRVANDLVPLGGSGVELILEDSRQVLHLDLDTEVTSELTPFPGDGDRRGWIYGGHLDATGRVLVGARGTASTYTFRPADRTFQQAAIFDADTAVTSFAPWPTGQRVLAGGYRWGEWRATLTVLDPAAPRFYAPTWVLGHGPVGRMRAGPGGRVWLILPWAATVAVVGPS